MELINMPLITMEDQVPMLELINFTKGLVPTPQTTNILWMDLVNIKYPLSNFRRTQVLRLQQRLDLNHQMHHLE